MPLIQCHLAASVAINIYGAIVSFHAAVPVTDRAGSVFIMILYYHKKYPEG